ncbi:hypothetical protein [Streptomyces albus]|nr:hypothetical protein [Streptomyces sp. NRRL F-5917]
MREIGRSARAGEDEERFRSGGAVLLEDRLGAAQLARHQEAYR